MNFVAVQAPRKNPYAHVKRIKPTTFFTAKKEKIRIAQLVLHINTAFITPYLCTNKFGTIRPTTLVALRMASYPAA